MAALFPLRQSVRAIFFKAARCFGRTQSLVRVRSKLLHGFVNDIAYQATTSLAVSVFVGALMIGLPVRCLSSVAEDKERGCYAVVPKNGTK